MISNLVPSGSAGGIAAQRVREHYGDSRACEYSLKGSLRLGMQDSKFLE